MPDRHRVKNHAQREQVGAAVRALATELLRRHIGGRAQNFAGQREVGEVQLGDAEVGDLGVPILRDQNIARLDVAVSHALGVRVIERVGNFQGQLQGLFQRKLLFARKLAVQRFPGNVLQHDIRIAILGFFADIEDGDDARMMQASGGLGFVEKSAAKFCFFLGLLPVQRNGLQGDDSVDLRIARLVDDAHGSAAQLADDLVPAEAFGLGIFHGLIHTPRQRCQAHGGAPLLC